MLVTINTDCSFKEGKAAYAFKVFCNVGVFERSGKLPDCKSPLEAEMMAIANSLHWATNNPKLWGISKIIVNTDCKHGIELITNSEKTLRTTRKRLKTVRKILKVILKYDINPLEFRHVTSHTNIKNGRSKANDWCDKAAKKVLGIC